LPVSILKAAREHRAAFFFLFDRLAAQDISSGSFLFILAQIEQFLGRTEKSVMKPMLNFAQRFSINLNLSAMKTKTCILVCLLLGFGLTQITAQKSNAKDTKSIQYWYESTYWAPVFCGGEFKELLEGGVITVHVVLHYKDGVALWEKDQIKGEVTSETGEIFQIRGKIDK